MEKAQQKGSWVILQYLDRYLFILQDRQECSRDCGWDSHILYIMQHSQK